MLRKAVQKVLDILEGSSAIEVIWARTPNVLLFAKSNESLLIGFGVGFSFRTYQAAQEQQRKENAELQPKVDRCTGWANRFLTLKNGDEK